MCRSTWKLHAASCHAVAVLLLSTRAIAQPVTNDTHRGSGLAGVGVLALTDDAAERTRFAAASDARVEWLVDAAVFVAPSLAVGVEALSLGTVTSSFNANCCVGSEQEQEAVILVTGRWRAMRHNRLGMDAVFGFGTVIQHRDTRLAYRFVPNSETRTVE